VCGYSREVAGEDAPLRCLDAAHEFELETRGGVWQRFRLGPKKVGDKPLDLRLELDARVSDLVNRVGASCRFWQNGRRIFQAAVSVCRSDPPIRHYRDLAEAP
jgi:hypothetical protein